MLRRKRSMGIEVNSRGRCRRFKLSRMIPNETQEEISNRVRHPSLTISCKAGVIAGERRARGLRTARNKTSSERRAYKMDSSGFGESASVWAPDGSRSSSCFVRVRVARFGECQDVIDDAKRNSQGALENCMNSRKLQNRKKKRKIALFAIF